ncbi:MAG: hypothetical protein K6E80_06400 [Schwartzia sp.]|nr:hypothetical protein [Schwartzia sp. (in: firmicutes)]
MGFFASDAEMTHSAALDAANIAGSNANKLNNLQQTVNSIDIFCGSAGNMLIFMKDQNDKLLEKMDQLIADNKALRDEVAQLKTQVNRMAGYTR